MTVREIAPERVVKIGTKNGSSYLFCGRFADADLPRINKYCAGQTTLAIMRQLDRIRLCGDSKKEKILREKLQHMELYREKYIPFGERKVVEEYPSILEDGVSIMIIPGTEDGDWEMVDEDIGVPLADNGGMIRLAGAICRGMMDELIARYTDCIKNPRSEGSLQAAKRAELYITESKFALLKDPRYLVMRARREAAEKIARNTIIRMEIIKTLGVRLDNHEQETKRL